MIKLVTVELRERVEAANDLNVGLYFDNLEVIETALEGKVEELVEINRYMRTEDYEKMPATIQNIIIDKHMELDQRVSALNAKRNRQYSFLKEALFAAEQ